MNYRPWKEALEREVQGLHLDAFQMLQLLEARTDGIALEIVKNNLSSKLMLMRIFTLFGITRGQILSRRVILQFVTNAG